MTRRDRRRQAVAFHCHGGGFVACPLDSYHFYGAMLVEQLGLRVVMPDYRLAPEHPYPAAHDDCLSAYRGLLESGVDPNRLVVMGDSCGGGLALSTLLGARDAGLPMPACFVSISGWFDLSVARPGDGAPDPFLTAAWVRNRGRDYTAGALPLDDPRVSPVYAELSGSATALPPAGRARHPPRGDPAPGHRRGPSWRGGHARVLARHGARLARFGRDGSARGTGRMEEGSPIHRHHHGQ